MTARALFDIEREINGLSAEERLLVRRAKSLPLLGELETWLREQRNKLSRSSNVLKPINYMLNRWGGFARFTEDGRICMTNNAAEHALRSLALGRKAWLFAGSDRGADRRPLSLRRTVLKISHLHPSRLGDGCAVEADWRGQQR